VLDFFVGALRETRTAVTSLEPAIAVDAVDLPAWEHRREGFGESAHVRHM
jgi:hypothetical protein